MSVVQSNSGSAINATSVSVAYTTNVASGNILVATASQNGNSIMTIGDTRGNTWVAAASATAVLANSGNQNSAVWYVSSSASGATTITVSGTVATADWWATVFEINGYASPPTAVGSGNGTSTEASIPSMSFGSGAFVIAQLDEGATTATETAGFTRISGITQRLTPTEYANSVSSPSTCAWALGTNANWDEVAAAFNVFVAVSRFFESGPKRQYRRGFRR